MGIGDLGLLKKTPFETLKEAAQILDGGKDYNFGLGMELTFAKYIKLDWLPNWDRFMMW